MVTTRRRRTTAALSPRVTPRRPTKKVKREPSIDVVPSVPPVRHGKKLPHPKNKTKPKPKSSKKSQRAEVDSQESLVTHKSASSAKSSLSVKSSQSGKSASRIGLHAMSIADDVRTYKRQASLKSANKMSAKKAKTTPKRADKALSYPALTRAASNLARAASVQDRGVVGSILAWFGL